MQAGGRHPLDETYFRRMEAIEFAVKYDDGIAGGLDDADIVLVGVSRTSKTPLSIYLGYLGYRAANVPIVKGIEPPKELFDVDPHKVVGLKIDAKRLAEIRKNRSTADGRLEPPYSKLLEIYEELDSAAAVQRKLGCPVIDTTELSIEETAARVIRLVEQRQAEAELAGADPLRDGRVRYTTGLASRVDAGALASRPILALDALVELLSRSAMVLCDVILTPSSGSGFRRLQPGWPSSVPGHARLLRPAHPVWLGLRALAWLADRTSRIGVALSRGSCGKIRERGPEPLRLRLRRALRGRSRPARRQGHRARGDDPARRARPGRLHDHDRRLPRVHARAAAGFLTASRPRSSAT